MSNPPSPNAEVKLSKNEVLKASSRGLRGTIAEELANDSASFSEASNQLLKFHGIYQQDDRDKRTRTPEGPYKEYSLMLRGRLPGGRLTAAQYLVWDDLAQRFGGGSLRITTRQSIQLHGVLKGTIKQVIQEINEAAMSTVGACGDVVRNVTEAPNPLGCEKIVQLEAYSNLLSDHFIAKSRAYPEIWLDGERLEHDQPAEADPIYGNTYLPRKFKIGVTVAGNNSIDLYTNDMGFAATFGPDEAIDGFFVFAGGGLGMTHNKPETFPRVADLLGWIKKDAFLPVAEAIVTTQRDHGNRSDRKQARLKYLIEKQGLAWFRQEVEQRSGFTFLEKALPAWQSPNYLGWQQTREGKWSLGFHTLAGRLRDREGYPIRSLLRSIVEKTVCSVQLTADQDLILLNLTPEQKQQTEALIAASGLNPFSPAPLYNKALACPALPTCGLAITEAERYFPEVLRLIQKLLLSHELDAMAPVVRMTGCPNGCARPYSAELGFVGRSGNIYSLFVGADPEGTRVAQLLADQVSTDKLSVVLDRLFSLWKTGRSQMSESFGDYAYRTGVAQLKQAIAAVL